MLGFKKTSKDVKPNIDGIINYKEYKISKSLSKNIEMLKKIFTDDDTILLRELDANGSSKVRCCACFINGMVNNSLMSENIIKPLMTQSFNDKGIKSIDAINQQILYSNEVKKSANLKEIIEAVSYGDTALFVDGDPTVLIINSKGWMLRSIAEPEAEKVLRGPREGFTEAILINMAMIRRKINTTDLKFKFKSFGTRTNTKVCICYLDSLVDKGVLKELNKRLEKIVIDGILDSNYLLEYIKDARLSPFKTVGITERPDTTAAKILEGRIAIIVDGSPVVLTVPYLFIENFQSSDDYYLNFNYATFGRILRILGFFLTMSIPAIYISLVGFHREMIPTNLILSIAESRSGVPFPTLFECVFVLLVFQIIKEAGLRMPSGIGQALSIVGALVIGQAAVEAKFISAPMVIVVAVTAITGLINIKIQGASIIFTGIFLVASSVLGLYGYFLAFITFLVHIFAIDSFGIQYTSQIASTKMKDAKDILFRAPWWKMKTRPLHLSEDEVRIQEDEEV